MPSTPDFGPAQNVADGRLQAMSKKFFRWGGGAVLMLGALVLAMLAAAVQGEPAVSLQPDPQAEDVARALAMVRTHDPRRASPGAVSALWLSERELDILLNHAAHRFVDAATRVSFEDGAATVRSSVHLPRNPFGRWLNVQARLQQTGGLPALDSLQLGRLPLPTWLGEWAALRLAARAGLLEELHLVAGVVQRVSFKPQQLGVVYAWRGDSADRMAQALVPAEEQQRLRVYSEQLAQVVARQGPGWAVSLAPLLGPMFALAQKRSGVAGTDAAAENRALIVVLTLFVNGRGVDAVLPSARAWQRARPLQVTLAGRNDFPRHFLVSAALAVESTSPLAKAIGVYKEVADSRGGTGFSFNDMAANRAGIRLGEWAIKDPLKLQAALARGVQETDFMPPWADLPSDMTETQFKQRFGGVGDVAYVAMLAEIERRVDALPVLRR